MQTEVDPTSRGLELPLAAGNGRPGQLYLWLCGPRRDPLASAPFYGYGRGIASGPVA